jgi:hypothetical protein
MRVPVFSVLFAGLLAAASPAAADVRVIIENGNVSVSATDATPRQILTEWARVGQTRIINVERVAGAPISVELTHVPEAQALDTLLRGVAGYLAAPREVATPDRSAYDRIFILATSAGAPARSAPSPAPPPTFTPPSFTPPPQDDQDDQDPPQPRRVQGPPNQPRAPAFNTFPQPATPPPREEPADTPAPASSPLPTGAVGVPTPGMVVPAPQQQPGQQPQGGVNQR